MKKYLLAGLLVWLPLAITIWVLHVGARRCSTACSAGCSRPRRPCCRWPRPRRIETLRHIPGLGVIVMLVGAAADRHVRDQHLRPVVAAPGQPAAEQDPDRQVDLQLGQAGLGHAVLQQRQRLPRGGAGAVPARRAAGPSPSSPASPAARWRSTWRGDYLSVYVPTTPNPTSGFFLMVPRARRGRAAHERGRSAQVRHLDGRGGAADAAPRAAGASPARN